MWPGRVRPRQIRVGNGVAKSRKMSAQCAVAFGAGGSNNRISGGANTGFNGVLAEFVDAVTGVKLSPL